MLPFLMKIQKKIILKDISFKIEKGEFIGIVGESGSGKTTFVDLLLGLLNAEKGEFILNNEPMLGGLIHGNHKLLIYLKKFL